jgi:thioester reductase-like protein
MSSTSEAGLSLGITVIGLAGRFPGASDIAGLWRNLMQGKESIRLFSQEEMRASGVPPKVYLDPAYIPAKGALDEDIALFDPHFFDMSPREAALVDPQHRAMLECAWEAFEDAAHDPRAFPGRIGVFAGAGKNTYLLFNLAPQEDLISSADVYSILAGNEKDYLAPRLAYALGLQGPSISVQTACSSGLVGVHLACQSLLSGECDMALVGAVAVDVPQFAGYHYREGAMLSRDGRCRPFDAGASGTVFGNGVAAVVLRRLEDAVADRDPIRAVILGTATNNDGGRKTAFGVPSLEGQSEVAVEALSVGAVDPATVGYIETHGTGTALGDRIEFDALRTAYGSQPSRSCVLGALKANIGHLGAAAGLAGLIKAVLALEAGSIPPSVGFERPAPELDIERSRFSVNASAQSWPLSGPRRAAVHATAVGGSNVHVVLQQAPSPRPSASGQGDRSYFLFLLSASSRAGVHGFAERLSRALRDQPSLSAESVAWTLQVGRRPLAFRKAIVAKDLEELKRALDAIDPAEELQAAADTPSVEQVCGSDVGAELSATWSSSSAAPFDELMPSGLESAGAREPADQLLALGALWCRGVALDWNVLGHPGAARAHLPARPFERVRCWVPPPSLPSIDREAGKPAPDSVHGALAALFAEHLAGHGPLRENDDFFQLGGTSIDALSLIAAIEKEFDVRLPSDAIFRHPTLAEMAEIIEGSQSVNPFLRRGALDDCLDVSGDWSLDDEIRPSGRARSDDVSSLLLTGATGFLGAHLLNAFLSASPRLTIFCLVRARSVEEGRRRIQARFRELALPEAAVDARVVPIPADLTQRRFGMTMSEFTVLAHAVETIVHCASQVSFIAGYPVLKSTNVDGVREVLRLASEGLEKPVHHVSSIAVFEADSLRGLDVVAEDAPLDQCHGFHNGYDLSKWVAERMIGVARQRGMAVSVYRPSNIAGDSRSGIILPGHIITCFVKGCLQLGAAPEDVTINLVCADFVAQAIASRSLAPAADALDFHLVNSEATPMRALIQWMQSKGYALEPITYSEWAERMIQAARDNAFRPFLPLLEQGPIFTGRTYARANTDAILGSTGRFYPFDEASFGRHIDHLVRIGSI